MNQRLQKLRPFKFWWTVCFVQEYVYHSQIILTWSESTKMCGPTTNLFCILLTSTTLSMYCYSSSWKKYTAWRLRRVWKAKALGDNENGWVPTVLKLTYVISLLSLFFEPDTALCTALVSPPDEIVLHILTAATLGHWMPQMLKFAKQDVLLKMLSFFCRRKMFS